ncbi:MAG: NAD(+) diphosphatase [Chloroflexota bacterium]|nr:NAD(+) diphosphatase [Chloroflexota bacterium]
MNQAFKTAVEPPNDAAGTAWWFAFRGGELLVRESAVAEAGGVVEVPLAVEVAEMAVGTAGLPRHYLGALGGVGCWAVGLPDEVEAPDGMRFEGLRALYGRVPEALFSVAGRAVQIVAWDRDHRFCGRCGAATEPVPGERAKRCPACGLTSFPRLSPAAIVRVARGPEVLLARAHNFPAAFFSVLAGFVEPGESLEETVMREVREEVGIDVADVRYFGSQPWPFPNSLMVGFTATYAGGEIRVDDREIAEAGWFRWDALPRIPPPISIARRLLDAFVVEQAALAGQDGVRSARIDVDG